MGFQRIITRTISCIAFAVILQGFHIEARQSRSNNFDMFSAGDSIDDSFNPFTFPFGNKGKNVILNKQIMKLKQQQSISRDELYQKIVSGLFALVNTVLYIQTFKGFSASIGLAAKSIAGILNPEKVPDSSGLHPNVSKFLTPNVTLNAFELEILQVGKYHWMRAFQWLYGLSLLS